jgi:hypothetical protein
MLLSNNPKLLKEICSSEAQKICPRGGTNPFNIRQKCVTTEHHGILENKNTTFWKLDVSVPPPPSPKDGNIQFPKLSRIPDDGKSPKTQ